MLEFLKGVAKVVFEEVAGVVRQKDPDYNEDFVFGSPQLDDDGSTGHDNRFFFDKSKGAFRCGHMPGENWDDANRGWYSHAEGDDTKAIGGKSHAEGYKTISLGANSHAEGNQSQAQAVDSHAEGDQTIASGIDSHAEGYKTEAKNARDHAEGNQTEASGGNSHAEGISSVASGGMSHAEGNTAKAEGSCSHAEGLVVTASGANSHAEGVESKAYLYTQHAKSSGKFSAQGDAQYSGIVARNQTTDATQTELFIDGSSTRIVLPASTTWVFHIFISARQTGGGSGTVGDSAGFEIKGVIKRDGANNTTLVGAITNTTIANDGAFGGSVTAQADDTNESLAIKVTGEADKNINWVAKVSLIECGG